MHKKEVRKSFFLAKYWRLHLRSIKVLKYLYIIACFVLLTVMIFQTVEWKEKWRSSSVFVSDCTALMLACIKYYCSYSTWKCNTTCWVQGNGDQICSCVISYRTCIGSVLLMMWEKNPVIPEEESQTPWFLFKQWNYRNEVILCCVTWTVCRGAPPGMEFPCDSLQGSKVKETVTGTDVRSHSIQMREKTQKRNSF